MRPIEPDAGGILDRLGVTAHDVAHVPLVMLRADGGRHFPGGAARDRPVVLTSLINRRQQLPRDRLLRRR